MKEEKQRGKGGLEQAKKVWKALENYRYVLLAALAGVLLLCWPSGEKPEAALAAPAAEEDPFQTSEMEEKLQSALSQIEGAGKVTVVLSLGESPRRVLAQDGRASGDDSRETSTVLVSKGSGGQSAEVLQQLGPVYRGALVVSPGAEDPQVRLALSEAVSALTGLGADKITICKGK